MSTLTATIDRPRYRIDHNPPTWALFIAALIIALGARWQALGRKTDRAIISLFVAWDRAALRIQGRIPFYRLALSFYAFGAVYLLTGVLEKVVIEWLP